MRESRGTEESWNVAVSRTTQPTSEPHENECARAGAVIDGKYLVEDVLGEGAMGIVLAARHLRLSQPVAIKLLRPSPGRSPDAIERLLREARTVSSLRNEHVARVTDAGLLPNGEPYLVMERLEGRTLAEKRKREGNLSVERAVEYILQVLVALAEAHALGIVHRDLKPSNLFVVEGAEGDASLKVLDFGIAKAQTAADDASLTASTAFLGSPTYIAPEQLRDPSGADARSDLWSVGVTLHELVAGRAPFEAPTSAGVLAKVAADPPVPLRTHRPDAPAALETVILRCLQKDPSRRYQSASQLGEALRELAPARAEASLRALGVKGEKRTWPVRSIAAVSAIVVCIGVWKLASRDDRAPRAADVTTASPVGISDSRPSAIASASAPPAPPAPPDMSNDLDRPTGSRTQVKRAASLKVTEATSARAMTVPATSGSFPSGSTADVTDEEAIARRK